MLDHLTQEDITEYGTNALTIDEPRGTDYTQGVQVGKTIPAKWWNWLFRAVTKRAQQAKADSQTMLVELKNTVIDAGITPDPADNTQLSQAASALSIRGVSTYVQDKKRGFFASWTSESCRGLPQFADSDIVTIDELKEIPGSDGGAFYLRLKQHTSDPVGDSYLHFTSRNLYDWYEIAAPNGAELQTADIVYFKDRYYFLYSVKDVHNAQLYYSDDAASWYFARDFSEYGALGLRVAANVLWMISASVQTYADINYYSYRTTDGINWTNAGTVFRNLSGTVDEVAPAVLFKGSYVIGNKITTDGLNWSIIITDWSNSASGNTVITSDGSAILQFNETEEAWYLIESPLSSPVKKLGTWVFKFMGPDGKILVKDSADDYAGITEDGDTFTKLSITYPTDPLAEFFKCEGTYILGNYKSDDLTTWTAITLPLGATSVQFSGITGYIIASNYFSTDCGDNWSQGLSAGIPFCAVPNYISDTLTCMAVTIRDNHVLRCITYNGVNRVIGTTLYLK